MNRLSRIALGFLLISSAAFAQEPPFEEKVDVNLVLVDVTVTDRAGNHMLGLTKDDFIVKENGKPQEIASVDYFTNRRLLTSPENQAAFKVERVKEQRYFIIYFEKLFDSMGAPHYPGELRRAARAAADFVEKDMTATDRVAVVGYDVRLKIFSDFTSDKAQLRKALDEAVTFSRGLMQPPADAEPDSILAHIDLKKMMNGDGRRYDGLETLAKAVGHIPARKALIYFSLGLGEPTRRNPYLVEPEENYIRPMIDALNKSNVTVYGVNMIQAVAGRTARVATEQTVVRMTDATGGEYFANPVNYGTPFKRVENVNNGYYMLSYYTKRAPGEHGYQKIDVSLQNPEFRVTARDGYPY